MTPTRAEVNRTKMLLASAEAWVRVATTKEESGRTHDAIASYRMAAKTFEKLGENGRVLLINNRIKKLQEKIDSINTPADKPIQLPKRTLTTPRRGRGRPVGTTSGIMTRSRIFDFIVAYKRKHDGNSPTSREIMDATDVSSVSVVHYHLRNLVDTGLVLLPMRASARSIVVRGGKWTFTQPEAKAGDETE